MFHIEFMGLPGSGKSTIRRNMINLLRQKSQKCFTTEEALLLSLKMKFDDRIHCRILKVLPNYFALRFITLLFDKSIHRFFALSRFLAERAEPLQAFLQSGQLKYITSDERALAISRFLETAAIYQTIDERMKEDAIVVFDEGFCQRTMSLFMLPQCENAFDKNYVHKFLDGIPIPKLLLYVKSDIEKCKSRMKVRGLTDRLMEMKSEEISSFLIRCKLHFNEVAEYIGENGGNVVCITNNGLLEDAVTQLSTKVLEITKK